MDLKQAEQPLAFRPGNSAMCSNKPYSPLNDESCHKVTVVTSAVILQLKNYWQQVIRPHL